MGADGGGRMEEGERKGVEAAVNALSLEGKRDRNR